MMSVMAIYSNTNAAVVTGSTAMFVPVIVPVYPSIHYAGQRQSYGKTIANYYLQVRNSKKHIKPLVNSESQHYMGNRCYGSPI